MCAVDCACDKMNRGDLRDALSDNRREHQRETLRCKDKKKNHRGFLYLSVTLDLDFRQLMKAIGGLRGQMSQLQVTVKDVADNQGAVRDVAEVIVFLRGFLGVSLPLVCF